MIDKMFSLYKKYKEIINYIIVGGLTFIVSVFSYSILVKLLLVNYQVSNIISWVLAVSFAYIMNKKFVFESKTKTQKELFKEVINFFNCRIASLFIEIIIMFVLIDMINLDKTLSKVPAQIIVIILNYFLSKLLVFKK